MTMNLASVAAYAAQFGVSGEDVLRIAVEEGLLRRAALVNGPFMLKGSYVTRQLLDEGWRRIPGDLDWVGLGQLDAAELTQWLTAVTETELDDGIRFRSFAENAFWRMIDYAMDDDFPTVNTDLFAWVDEQPCNIPGMDVSFGLKLQPPPRPLSYIPQFGDAFVLPTTCPLELQLAWKLHQCLLRPRFKDMLDLILLLRENVVDTESTWRALEDECRHDGTPISRFDSLLDGTIGEHPHWQRLQKSSLSAADYFSIWRSGDGAGYWAEPAMSRVYIDGDGIAAAFGDFLAELAYQLKRAGFARTAPGAPSSQVELVEPKSTAPQPVGKSVPGGITGLLRRWIARRS